MAASPGDHRSLITGVPELPIRLLVRFSHCTWGRATHCRCGHVAPQLSMALRIQDYCQLLRSTRMAPALLCASPCHSPPCFCPPVTSAFFQPLELRKLLSLSGLVHSMEVSFSKFLPLVFSWPILRSNVVFSKRTSLTLNFNEISSASLFSYRVLFFFVRLVIIFTRVFICVNTFIISPCYRLCESKAGECFPHHGVRNALGLAQVGSTVFVEWNETVE